MIGSKKRPETSLDKSEFDLIKTAKRKNLNFKYTREKKLKKTLKKRR